MQTSLCHPFLHRAYKRFATIPKSRKTASYFTLTLSLLTLSFFGIFAIRPTLTTAITLLKSVQDLRKLVNDYEGKIGSIVRAQDEYTKIRNDIPLLEAALPKNASFHKLAQALEKFAERENFTITQLQIDNAPISTLPPSSKTHTLGFHLAGNGDYPSILAFISHLLNWKRIVNLNSLELIQEGGTNGALRLTLRGATYYEP